ncbi:BTAD domain-containing putative transcriptional regulator [Streptomyces cacaoi]|uniref:SARP family transcriptional regulator n=1 Tax=Streptomyces cacaoi TaxID=1898 RepID=A0A4Y3REY0_STRCI|nr:BTAD domain-containing putative transcriptional regulator [Streptomyces cacaoi]NNG84906.1 SARP family transcriptional regulator [Streptomyces cacaoi]GEB54340.1 SARP family transcriptional regulator [Streptomyces cacaoi]
MRVEFGVLGPVTAWDEAGEPVALRGPRHRAVLARLIIARRRVVPVSVLVEDLWPDPPAGAVATVRSFVAALRRALEPGRAPRTPARLLVTEGPGYALRAGRDDVDAWRFEQALASVGTLPPRRAAEELDAALALWRGPAYAEFAEEPWARAERARLAELRLGTVERRAEALLALGRGTEAVSELDAHVTEHPWREDAWRLLALALYRDGRQGDALAVLRRARALLVEQLGVDPGPRLLRLEADVLAQAEHLEAGPDRDAQAAQSAQTAQSAQSAQPVQAEQVWARAATAYDRTVAPGARARLESTVGLLRDLAVTGGGGLTAAREHREAAVEAAEELGDAELTARVIGAYDVPAIWTRSDDPRLAARLVDAAERTLAGLPPGTHPAVRARLLATVALESRGSGARRADRAAREAEETARGLDDPALLAFALNGVFMQSFGRTGLAAQRDATGAELVAVSARNGLVSYEVLGHLIRLQARAGLGDFPGADTHAAAADRLAERHERPLVTVFTRWYAALRRDAVDAPSAPEAEAAYRDAAALLEDAGMPGLRHGLLPLALLCVRVRRSPPAPAGRAAEDTDWGPYAPWARPLVLLAEDRRDEAAAALRRAPDPPHDLLAEALWALTGHAAVALGDRETMRRVYRALAPAAGELAGAGSGLLTVGPVTDHLTALATALGHRP